MVQVRSVPPSRVLTAALGGMRRRCTCSRLIRLLASTPSRCWPGSAAWITASALICLAAWVSPASWTLALAPTPSRCWARSATRTRLLARTRRAYRFQLVTWLPVPTPGLFWPRSATRILALASTRSSSWSATRILALVPTPGLFWLRSAAMTRPPVLMQAPSSAARRTYLALTAARDRIRVSR